MILRRICSGERQARDVLAVPYFAQLDHSVACVPASIKMVVEYYREYYRSDRYHDQIPELSMADIAGLIKTKPNLGTTFKPEHGAALTAELNILRVDFVKGRFDHERLSACFHDHRPVVVWFDGSLAYYRRRRGEGGGHAAVMVAIDEEVIVLNDPQIGPWRAMSINDFMPAWDILDRKVVCFDIRPPQQLATGPSMRTTEAER